MIYYLSGPMERVEGKNHSHFNKVATILREKGLEVLNPAENDGGSTEKSREFYLRLDLQLLSKANSIVMLKGWESSAGCAMELTIAKELNYNLYWFNDDLQHLVCLPPSSTVLLDRAKGIVIGARQAAYGSPERNLTRIGQAWGALLSLPPISPRKVGLMMITLKCIRDSFTPKEDNLVDIYGYANLIEQLKSTEER